MEQTKRRIIVVFLLMFLCCTLVGCSALQLLSGAQSSNNGKITLTLWYPKNSIEEGLYWQLIINELNVYGARMIDSLQTSM
jgi:hypothetical protein